MKYNELPWDIRKYYHITTVMNIWHNEDGSKITITRNDGREDKWEYNKTWSRID